MFTTVGLMFVVAGLIATFAFDAPVIGIGLNVIGLVLCIAGVVDAYRKRHQNNDAD